LEDVLSVRAQLEANLKMKHKLVNEKTAMQICIEQELAAAKTPSMFHTPSMPINPFRVMMYRSQQVDQRPVIYTNIYILESFLDAQRAITEIIEDR
jgi:hypothetical protein